MTARPEARTFAELAKDALREGRRDQAAAILAEARQTPPRDALSLRTLASVAVVLQDGSAAAELLQAAIAAHAPPPAPAAWYRALGEMWATQGNLSGALHALRAALAQSPHDADSWRWLARVLRRVDDLPAAVAACRRAVELSPEEWPARGDLAVVLMDAGHFEEAATAFDEAAVRAGDVPALVVGRAKLDARCGRRREAITALESCLARHPNHTPALAALALAERDEGRFDDAAAAFRRALEQAPGEAAFWCGLGRTLLEAGDAEQASRVAAAYLEKRPGYAGALALEVSARQALGDADGANHLLGGDRFVVQRRLPVPQGFADLSSFNLALASAVSKHPTLHRAPLRHATSAGLHSGSLLIDPSRPIESLQQTLNAAVADYGDALPSLPEHPFVARKPKSWRLDMWCVVLERGGHQVPHIHPEAWLSGVYYPQLPEALRAGGNREGWLAFGEPDRPFPVRCEARVWYVQPQEGLLVLFPSYFYHRTIPFGAEGTRISVAFDVLAAD